MGQHVWERDEVMGLGLEQLDGWMDGEEETGRNGKCTILEVITG